MVVKQERPRYLLVEFTDNTPDKRKLVKVLRDKIAYLGGQLALSKSNVHVVDVVNNYAIIRAQHESRDIVEVAVQLLDFKSTVPVVRTVSGTIKSINEHLSTNIIDDDE